MGKKEKRVRYEGIAEGTTNEEFLIDNYSCILVSYYDISEGDPESEDYIEVRETLNMLHEEKPEILGEIYKRALDEKQNYPLDFEEIAEKSDHGKLVKMIEEAGYFEIQEEI